jgi:exosortase
MSRVSQTVRQLIPSPTPANLLAIGVGLALLFAFWPTFLVLADRWGNDPRYSHGYLVPLFSLYLLWSRRSMIAQRALVPSWIGLGLLLVGLGVRFAGSVLFYEWLGAIGLLPCIAGLALLIGGRPVLRWAWPAIAFLVFMMPLPFRVEIALAHPLQRIATQASTYSLQTLGFVAVAEGNTIRMGDVHLGVVEACSGLSMLVIFFALSTAVAVIIRRPIYEKVLVFLSAIPIALTANIARITVTGVLHKTAGAALADLVFHDLAGWLMMPLALGMMWLELRTLAWVIKDLPLSASRPIPSVFIPGMKKVPTGRKKSTPA